MKHAKRRSEKSSKRKRLDPVQHREEKRLARQAEDRYRELSDPVGRPTEYTDELGDQICAKIASGISLTRICKDKTMPCLPIFYRWTREHPEFAKRYAQAREDQADTYADESLDIADTPEEGQEIVERADGGKEIRRGDMLGHRKLRVETRKWFAAKMQPKKYGDRQNVALSNPDGGPLELKNPDELTDEQLADIASRSSAASSKPPKS